MPRVLVARPQAQSAELLRLLVAAGFDAGHLPLMEITSEPDALAALPGQAATADCLIFVSPSAIDQAWPALRTLDLAAKRLVCVGRASAAKLAALSGRTALHPAEGSDSEALLALPELADMRGQRVLIVRGVGGRPLLAQSLAARGAAVEFAEIYRRLDGAPDWAAFDRAPPDAVIVTSGEIVEQLFRLAGPSRIRTLQCLLYCVPHPRVADRLAAQGATRIMTTRAEDSALVAGLKKWFCRHP
ncbi:uroporphyrinogen-III synthase [Chromobacterium haemolyticum]|uniref:Uroporphyrinogen-III synthase n=1 Tax=Chromobacterium fluminis TaxID=3044269 RepID=A0ABX0KYU6_9NEIS|nr:uroporphyrinogen-III synthase [Chromobacterium haemolyticum]NHR03818.1 uroporphyrinogen-III synthase [Chromobacterium haemolyticum]